MEEAGDINCPEFEELHDIAECLINNEDPMELIDRFNSIRLSSLIQREMEKMDWLPPSDSQRIPNAQPNARQNVGPNSHQNAHQPSGQSNDPQDDSVQENDQQQNSDAKEKMQGVQQGHEGSQDSVRPKESSSRNATKPKVPASGSVKEEGQPKMAGRSRPSFRSRYYRKSVQISYRVERKKDEQLVVETKKKIIFAKKE